jgi:hypothetical protein
LEEKEEIPYGFCHCGCGGKSTIAKQSLTKLGWVKGEPKKFIRGHSGGHGGTKGVLYASEQDRFWSRVDVKGPDECWVWLRGKIPAGYGMFITDAGKHIGAHIYSRSLVEGQIPAGLCVLHKCDNPSCVNPNHLSVGTQQDNIADKVAKNRQARGETQGSAKLTDSQVLEIRSIGRSMNQRDIAKQFNVCQRTVQKILSGSGWSHI